MINVINNNKKYLIVLLILVLYYIIYKIFHIGVPCIFNYITGLYCPGCGLTRMCISILKLDFYQAFRYNPFVFVLLVLTIIYLIIKFILLRFKNIKISIPQYVYYIIIVLAIIFMILRNIDAFSYLAPTVI